jgi:diadenosine tetraphosphate (Ap4A) HIT family hydrolase
MRTWPEDWEDRRRGVDCIACTEGRPDRIPSGLRVFAGRHADAYLIRDRAASGYTLVFWRGRHVADLTDLTEQEMCGYASELRLIARAIEVTYRPAKLNYLTLGNSLPHLHTHIVPRYVDDPDPGRPPRFMMVDRTWPLLPAAEYAHQLEGLGAAIRRLKDDPGTSLAPGYESQAL